mmetsp:Transcript_13607/g.43024  ORF Transcript_13607/g.43024 Transcript_13607/m.43024 type:complete len:134 (-) Transcript_13607:459-860(-)
MALSLTSLSCRRPALLSTSRIEVRALRKPPVAVGPRAEPAAAPDERDCDHPPMASPAAASASSPGRGEEAAERVHEAGRAEELLPEEHLVEDLVPEALPLDASAVSGVSNADRPRKWGDGMTTTGLACVERMS